MPTTAQRTSIRILLFGPMAKEAEAGTVRIDIDGDRVTCAALRGLLATAYPRLAKLLPACRFAVNSRFAGEEQVITPADEVALIGMVSGG